MKKRVGDKGELLFTLSHRLGGSIVYWWVLLFNVWWAEGVRPAGSKENPGWGIGRGKSIPKILKGQWHLSTVCLYSGQES